MQDTSLDRPANVLLVEDNITTSETLVLFLRHEGYSVECAFDGREALECFRSRPFDLVVLDLMLPHVDGLTVCQTIRESSQVPIVMLTAKTSEDDIVAGLECGADDYVCKPFGSKELLARIRRCLRHFCSAPAACDVIRCGQIEVDKQRRTATVAGLPIKLTKSEFEILSVLISQPGRVFTRGQLISKAMGPNFDGFDRSIDTHIWNLRKKIGEPRGNPKYIHSEPGIGYRMNDQHAP